MAEHGLMTDAQFLEMEERRNKQFDRIDFLLEALLQKHNCSQSSSRGAMNSCQETLQQPLHSNYISPVAELSREFNLRRAELSREIKQSYTRMINLLEEEMQANESTNDALPTSEETLPSIEPIDEQSPDESVGVKTSMVESVTPIAHRPLLNHDASHYLSGEFRVLNLTKFAHAQLIASNSILPLLTPSGRSIQNATVEFKVTWEHTVLLPPPKPPVRVEIPIVRNLNSYADGLGIWLVPELIVRPPAKPPDLESLVEINVRITSSKFVKENRYDNSILELAFVPFNELILYVKCSESFGHQFAVYIFQVWNAHHVFDVMPKIIGVCSNSLNVRFITASVLDEKELLSCEFDDVSGSTLIVRYTRQGGIQYAFNIFERLPAQVDVAWYCLIGCWAIIGMKNLVPYLFRCMVQLGFLVNHYSLFVCCLINCQQLEAYPINVIFICDITNVTKQFFLSNSSIIQNSNLVQNGNIVKHRLRVLLSNKPILIFGLFATKDNQLFVTPVILLNSYTMVWTDCINSYVNNSYIVTLLSCYPMLWSNIISLFIENSYHKVMPPPPPEPPDSIHRAIHVTLVETNSAFGLSCMLVEIDCCNHLAAANHGDHIQEVEISPLAFRVLNCLITAFIFKQVNKLYSLKLLATFSYVCGGFVLLESLELLDSQQSLVGNVRNKIQAGMTHGLFYHYCGWVTIVSEPDVEPFFLIHSVLVLHLGRITTSSNIHFVIVLRFVPDVVTLLSGCFVHKGSSQFNQWDPGGCSFVHWEGLLKWDTSWTHVTWKVATTPQHYHGFNLEDKVDFKG